MSEQDTRKAETARLHADDCRRQETQRQRDADALQAGYELGQGASIGEAERLAVELERIDVDERDLLLARAEQAEATLARVRALVEQWQGRPKAAFDALDEDAGYAYAECGVELYDALRGAEAGADQP